MSSPTETPPPPRNYHPLKELVVARVREFIREPAAVFWVYVFPLLMMVALGVAFRERPPEKTALCIHEGDRAEALARTLRESERFNIKVQSAEECAQLLRTGQVDLVIEPESSGAGLVFHFDPTKPGGLATRDAANDVLQRAAGRADVLAVRESEMREQGSRYIDYLLPGLIGMGLMGGGLWGVGFAIVDLRIRKLLKRMLATPMKRTHFLASMMISRLLFTVPEVLFLLILGRLLFGVHNEGDYLSLVVLILIGAFQFAAIGLLVASRAQKLETVSGLMNMVMLPMWMFGAIFFPVERFPEFIQPALKLLPLEPLNHAMRAVMLEGQSLFSQWDRIAVMLVWGSVCFVLALKLFRWK